MSDDDRLRRIEEKISKLESLVKSLSFETRGWSIIGAIIGGGVVYLGITYGETFNPLVLVMYTLSIVIIMILLFSWGKSLKVNKDGS